MVGNLPLVTIGLPIYNRPEGLRRTLDCIIHQTYTNIEIIIADNCSPNPEVEQIAREYLEKDKRITYYRHDSNKGWGFNTVFVIEKAKGDYFLRATDDDWWESSFIEKMINLHQQDENILVASSEFAYVDEAGNECWTYGVKSHIYYLKAFTTNKHFVNLKNYINQFEGFGKATYYLGLYKTSILKNEIVYSILRDELLEGDLLINFYCLLRGKFALDERKMIHFTIGNPKYYTNEVVVKKRISFIFLEIDFKKINTLYKKWNPYFLNLKKLVNHSELTFREKFSLNNLIFLRKLGFIYDLIASNSDSRPINIFYRIRRKYNLE
jgi:glycosyltransferase involved in cell wall biosynthesis